MSQAAVQTQTRPERTRVTQNKKTIKEQLEGESFKSAVSKILPTHCTPDRFVRVAILAVMRNPDLANCDQESFFNCLMSLSAMGLEPDGRRAHLIPFWNSNRRCYECTLIVDYKGLSELAMRSGFLSEPPIAQIVCANDDFDWNKGKIVYHRVDWKKPRGEMYAAYTIVHTKEGGETAEVMTKDEIDAIKGRSKSKNREGKLVGPWVTDYFEMAKKTVFRRHSKWLPLSPEFRDAVEADDEAAEESRVEAARTIIPFTPESALVDVVPPAETEQPKDETKEPPAETEQPKAAELEPKDELAKFVVDELGCAFDDFKAIAPDLDVKDVDSMSGFGEVKSADAKRLLRAKTGLGNLLKAAKLKRLGGVLAV